MNWRFMNEERELPTLRESSKYGVPQFGRCRLPSLSNFLMVKQREAMTDQTTNSNVRWMSEFDLI